MKRTTEDRCTNVFPAADSTCRCIDCLRKRIDSGRHTGADVQLYREKLARLIAEQGETTPWWTGKGAKK